MANSSAGEVSPESTRATLGCLDEIDEDDEADANGGPDEEDEELDPRIKEELEKLNTACNDINGLEQELDDARNFFHQCLSDATRSLRLLADNLGNSVDKARPYFEALVQAQHAQQICQEEAAKYEKACNVHRGAREAIKIAEQKLTQHPGTFDAAWQEMLNHADMKVVEAEQQKERSEQEHQDACLAYSELEARATVLERKLKKAVNKARPYFEQRGKQQEYLQEQKKRIQDLETRYSCAKEAYAQALKNLESISEEIHSKRQQLDANEDFLREPRQQGVGAESDASPDEDPRVRRERMSLSRKEDKLRRILDRRRPLTKSTLRSSLCFDLGYDFDIGDVLASPSSPSTKSIDLGDVLSRSFEDYAVLDVKAFQSAKRRESLRRTKSEAPD